MKFTRINGIIGISAAFLTISHANLAYALNNQSAPSLSDGQIFQFLGHPDQATAAYYHIHDDGGNTLDSASILQVSGQAYKYVAVYHHCIPASAGGCQSVLKLSGSNDLNNWFFIRNLATDAGMPRISQISNGQWIVVSYEKWTSAFNYANQPISITPSNVKYDLYYNSTDLFSGTVRASYAMPTYNSPNGINGTPSFYELHASLYYGQWWAVDGQYGFHLNTGQSNPSDINGVTTTYQMFNPNASPSNTWANPINQPSVAINYNNLFLSQGATQVGQRDTLVTNSSRYNIQEANMGTGWDTWRLWLFKFGDPYNYPTGNGTLTAISPVTPYGFVSFGNPSVNVMDSPDGTGKAVVISCFTFTYDGSPHPEMAGPMLWYYDIGS